MNKLEKAFELAKERYAEIGVDVDAALKKIATVAVSLHCWQGDDVGGFRHQLRAGSGPGGHHPGGQRGHEPGPVHPVRGSGRTT